ncbi:MAG: hypothetical protein HS111_05290 [Kofleriaceae bacterium]|nr:hypothetical protein [Kofleriaceae bacterium]MCL4228708.1 hypothetical protein [Myxococcales bacterium]
MAKPSSVSIPSLSQAARQVAERLTGLVGEAEARRLGVADALRRIAEIIREVAAAANEVAPDSARLLFDDDLRRMKEHHGPTEALALVLGRGHVVAGLLTFQPTPDGYIEAAVKTWRSNTAPVARVLGRHEPADDEAHRRAIHRFLELVDREMGSPPPASGDAGA